MISIFPIFYSKLADFDSHKVMLFEISISVPSHMLTLHDSVWPKKVQLENFGFRSTVSFVGWVQRELRYNFSLQGTYLS